MSDRWLDELLYGKGETGGAAPSSAAVPAPATAAPAPPRRGSGISSTSTSRPDRTGAPSSSATTASSGYGCQRYTLPSSSLPSTTASRPASAYRSSSTTRYPSLTALSSSSSSAPAARGRRGSGSLSSRRADRSPTANGTRGGAVGRTPHARRPGSQDQQSSVAGRRQVVASRQRPLHGNAGTRPPTAVVVPDPELDLALNDFAMLDGNSGQPPGASPECVVSCVVCRACVLYRASCADRGRRGSGGVVATPPLEEDSTISDELLAQMLQQEMLAELERDTANHHRGTSPASVALSLLLLLFCEVLRSAWVSITTQQPIRSVRGS